jgi:hypothetical protein
MRVWIPLAQYHFATKGGSLMCCFIPRKLYEALAAKFPKPKQDAPVFNLTLHVHSSSDADIERTLLKHQDVFRKHMQKELRRQARA